MNKVISFKDYIKDSDKNDFLITNDDIFNLFLIFKSKEESLFYPEFDASVLMKSLAKHSSLEKFDLIFKNISIEKNEAGIEFVNLNQSLEKKQQEKLILVNPNNKNEIYILGSDEEFKKIASLYDEKILKCFDELMFCINMDLEFGIGNWEIVFKDEIIDVPKYPNYVTAEFIDQDKSNSLVKKKMKQKAIKNLKNIYE